MGIYLHKDSNPDGAVLSLFLPLQLVRVRDVQLGDIVREDHSPFCVVKIDPMGTSLGLLDPNGNGCYYDPGSIVSIVARASLAGTAEERVQHAKGESYRPWSDREYAPKDAACALFEGLTAEERSDVLEHLSERWCPHCGDDQPEHGSCQCWNDE